MKKLFLVLLICLLLTSAAYAAPLTDFNWGRASMDANFDLNIASINNGDQLNGLGLGSDFAGTVGVTQGNYGGFAVQAKYANYSGPSKSQDSVSVWISAEKQEYNIIYQLPFAIPVKIQPYIGLDFVNWGLGAKDSDSGNRSYNYLASSYGFHGGVAVDYAFASDSWNIFANVDGGNTNFDVGAGVSYTPIKNVDVNLGIKYDCFFAGIRQNGKDNLNFITPYVGATLKF